MINVGTYTSPMDGMRRCKTGFPKNHGMGMIFMSHNCQVLKIVETALRCLPSLLHHDFKLY